MQVLPPIQLWQMPSAQFNDWRAENDIPDLFEFLATLLPSFNEWIESTGVDAATLHRFVPLGDLFAGSNPKVYYRNPEPETFGNVYQCTDAPAEAEVERWSRAGKVIAIEGSFEPYFKWLKLRSGDGGYFLFDRRNSQYANTFVYSMWVGGDARNSRAHLFKAHPVLKLGGITLPPHVSFDARNLDFCDLDHLVVGEGWTGSRWKPINYSSCRSLSFIGTNANFFDFSECSVYDLVVRDSKVQDLHFKRCSATTMRFESSTLSKISFVSTQTTLTFEGCQPSQIEYRPDPCARHYVADANAFRAIRSMFQGVGLTSEASRFFYLEQCARRKALFSPYAQHRDAYQGLTFPPDISVFKGPVLGGAPSMEVFRQLRLKRNIFRLQAWLHPRYALTSLKFKLKWATSAFDWLVWGYGERPARLFGGALAVILLYATVFSFMSTQIKVGNADISKFVDCLYFSMVTFSTLGYGDILPATSLAKLLCGSEAILGAFTMGLFVAGFSNRNRY